MKRNIAHLASIVTLGLAAQATMAQETPSYKETIVVVGKRPAGDVSTVRNKIDLLVPKQPRDKPLPRATRPICFGVIGASRAFMTQVANRMVDVAGEAGARLGQEGCKPNFVLMFVDSGRVEAKKAYSERGYIFGGADPRRVSAFIKETGPVRFLATVNDIGADNTRTNDYSAPPAGLNFGFDAPTLQNAKSGRINSPIQRSVDSAILVIDRAVVVGKSALQVADYATMRLLADARNHIDLKPDETILSLFDSDAAPSEMTALDKGYLAAVYEGPGNAWPTYQLNLAARLAVGETVIHQ